MMQPTIPAPSVIDSDELRRLMADDPSLRILDVRTGAEFRMAHIPGSYNVPLDTLGEHVRDLADVAHEIVLVCQSGGRAGRAHAKLRAAGKDTLHILEGGMQAWQLRGGRVVQLDADHWSMDRQVRLAAGGVALAALLASVAVPAAKWLAAGVGGGLVVSAVTNTCAMASLLAKLPYNRGDRCDIAGVLGQLNREAA